MSDIVTVRLPHGRVPVETVSDPQARDVLRKLDANITKLASVLAALNVRLERLEAGG